MASGFHLFGPVHIVILASIAGASAVMAWRARQNATTAKRFRLAWAVLLATNEIAWWIYRLHYERIRFPNNLPLQLSDFTLWLTIIALFTLWGWAYEVAYYAGLAGAAMAVLTPDLWAPFPSYPSIYFFVEHGGVIIAILMLTCGKVIRPRPGSVWRAFLILNIYAATVGIFNAMFGTNYMFLARKPAAPSLLDYFGPWPLYLVPAYAVGLALFWLLWLPFRKNRGASL